MSGEGLEHDAGPDPAAAMFLIGVLAASLLTSAHARVGLERARRLALAERPAAPERPFAQWSARELRALPGLGERRAVAIVRARWEGSIAGDPESLDGVPGIGPATVAAIEAELARREQD